MAGVVPLNRRLPISQRIGYSIGHVLNDLTASMWFSYLIIYFQQVIGFNNILSGLLMLIGQVSDALFTPFIGFQSDNTEGICNMGKRKSWHFVGTLCVIGSFPFIFNKCIECDTSPTWTQFIYYAAFVIIFQFGWAETQINHLSLIPDLTPDATERTELTGMRYAFTVISNVIIFGVFWLLFYVNDDGKGGSDYMLNKTDSERFRNLCFIAVGIGIVFSFLFHVIVREPIHDNSIKAKDLKGNVNTAVKSKFDKHLMTWKCWLKEMQFYQVAMIYMCTRLFVNLTQIYLPLYITETLKMQKDNVAVMPLVVYISGFVTSLVMKPINTKVGRKAETSIWTYGAAGVLGIGSSTMLVTSLAMTADLIAENTESGGFVYGSFSFTDKLSNGAAVVLIQFMNPCTQCNDYYRTVLTFIPGGVAVVACISLLSLFSTEIGTRKAQVVVASLKYQKSEPIVTNILIPGQRSCDKTDDNNDESLTTKL